MKKDICQLWPTTVLPANLAMAVCMALLGNASIEADLVFNETKNKVEQLNIQKGTRLIRGMKFGDMSGIDFVDRKLRIGNSESVQSWLGAEGGVLSPTAIETIKVLAQHGKKALLVADQTSDLGIVAYDQSGALSFQRPDAWIEHTDEMA